MVRIIIILSYSLSIFLCSVRAKNVQCPAIETISGLDPNQIAGEWHAIHAVLLEDIEGIPTDKKSINSPKCRAIKISSLNDKKMSLASHFMTFNSSDRTVNEEFKGYCNIRKVNEDGFQADIFTKTSEGIVSNEEENPDLYTHLFSVVPDKYLVYVHCRVVEKEKTQLSGAAIYSRRSSDFQPVITQEEKTTIVEEIKQKTGGEIKTEVLIYSEDCFSGDREYFA